MSTILITNPTENQVLEHIDSKIHYVEANNIVLAMSDLKRWFKAYDKFSDFLYLENGYCLCKVDEDEEIYSEEQTLITAG